MTRCRRASGLVLTLLLARPAATFAMSCDAGDFLAMYARCDSGRCAAFVVGERITPGSACATQVVVRRSLEVAHVFEHGLRAREVGARSGVFEMRVTRLSCGWALGRSIGDTIAPELQACLDPDGEGIRLISIPGGDIETLLVPWRERARVELRRTQLLRWLLPGLFVLAVIGSLATAIHARGRPPCGP